MLFASQSSAASRWAALALLGLVACAPVVRYSRYPPPPTEAERAAFGRMVVIASAQPTEFGVGALVSGPFAGCALGFARGLVAAPLFAFRGLELGGGHSGEPLLGALGMVVGAAVGVLYLPVSAMTGASGPSSEKTAAAEAAAAKALGEQDLGAALRGAFVIAAPVNSRVRYPPTGAGGESRSLAAWGELGIDTVVTVGVARVSGRSTSDWVSFDGPFPVNIVATIRLVRTAEGASVYQGDVTYSDPIRQHRLSKWVANDASALREEMRRATKPLADALVEQVFLRYRMSDDGQSLGLKLRPARLDGGRPTLEWEAFPSARDLKNDPQGLLSSATHVGYDLQIYRVTDPEFSYARTGLPTNEHSVAETLPPGEYRWRVRPRFRIDHAARVGEWSGASRRPLALIPLREPKSAFVVPRRRARR